MRFDIRHVTRYRYDRPAFLEPQTFRLRPRESASQNLLRYSLEIGPRPAGLVQSLDAEGNSMALAWFEGLCDGLTLSSTCTVITSDCNPFGFLLTDGCERLPVHYPAPLNTLLAPCMGSLHDDDVVTFSQQVAKETGNRTLDFLVSLAATIERQNRHVVRPHGPPVPAAATLAAAYGSCRDLAVLFIETCRAQGLAARFVSGYQAEGHDNNTRHLHAWAEVFLPGGGWRGFDPSQGLAVADRHVAVAASSAPANTLPVSGFIRGDGLSAAFDYEITIEHTPP